MLLNYHENFEDLFRKTYKVMFFGFFAIFP